MTPSEKSTVDSWATLKSWSGKIAIIVALITGLQFLIPEVKKWIVGDDVVYQQDLDAIKDELISELRDSVHILRSDYHRLHKDFKGFIKHYTDEQVKGQSWFAITLRVDPKGDMWYRDRHGDVYRVIPDYERWQYMYYNKEGQLKICFWEH